MALQTSRLSGVPPVDEARLRRFARLALPLLAGRASAHTGRTVTRTRPGAGLDFLDVRPYAAGEDIRHLDWRQTARRRQPMIRRYRDESATDWLLAVDGSASMRFGRKWQAAVELATALAYALLQGGDRVALAVFDEELRAWIPAGRGPRHFSTLVGELGSRVPRPGGGASVPGVCAASARRVRQVFLLSDFLREDAMEPDLRVLRAAGPALDAIRIRSADETAPAGRGPVLIRDAESGGERVVTLSAASTASVAAALHAHEERLETLARALNLRLSRCRDDEDWERVLLAHLGA